MSNRSLTYSSVPLSEGFIFLLLFFNIYFLPRVLYSLDSFWWSICVDWRSERNTREKPRMRDSRRRPRVGGDSGSGGEVHYYICSVLGRLDTLPVV